MVLLNTCKEKFNETSTVSLMFVLGVLSNVIEYRGLLSKGSQTKLLFRGNPFLKSGNETLNSYLHRHYLESRKVEGFYNFTFNPLLSLDVRLEGPGSDRHRLECR